MPDSTSELVTRCFDGGDEFFTILLNARMTSERLRSAYDHAISHIENHDFDAVCDVGRLEQVRHV